MKLFLASASPRRVEILNMTPFPFEQYIPVFDERAYEKEILKQGIAEPLEITIAVAKGKGLSALKELKEKYPAEEIVVLSADTIVLLENKIYGKGETPEKARKMLRELNGKMHEVISAVWILSDNIEKKIVDVSKVYFADSKDSLLERYIREYRPFDKAGAYGIQDGGALLVDKIEGSYHNIMGLPLRPVYEALDEIWNKEKEGCKD